MINNYIEKRLQKDSHLRSSIDKMLAEGEAFFEHNLTSLNISGYRYDINEAVEELALEEEIIAQLVEDYIIQILKSNILFYKYIQKLKEDKSKGEFLDYTNIRNLAHKNLGVVRNLRIKDAIKILEEMMKERDLEHLELCVKALEISAVRLDPETAYETIKLIRVKNFL